MNSKKYRFLAATVIILSLATACSPKATPTPVDIMGTAAQLASSMLTQTVAAFSPTPLPPTETATPSFTDTPIPTETNSAPPKRPVVMEFTGCWTGPGDTYTLISNIDPKKYVDVIGIGSEPGWYVIRNPYFHNPCWIEIAHLKIDPRMDFSVFPVMTPGP
ncbi:MAG: hypothetical protein K8S20_16610 [Chloroflexi bacterium]|nr:hypothetical protein [Chloroflexota bacterium]